MSTCLNFFSEETMNALKVYSSVDYNSETILFFIYYDKNFQNYKGQGSVWKCTY